MKAIIIFVVLVQLILIAFLLSAIIGYLKYRLHRKKNNDKARDFWHWIIFDPEVEDEKVEDAPLLVSFVKLKLEAKVPTHGSDGAAGYDLYALIKDNGEVKIEPNKNYLFHTGISMAIPEGYFVGVYPRSGLATKRGLRLSNCTAVIDSDYRGEIMVSLYNDSGVAQTIHSGDRIAQAVFQPFKKAEFIEASKLNETDRGEGGFGSTGDK